MATKNTRYVDVDANAGGNGTTAALTGTDCAYKSLNIWEAARDDVGDLVTNDTIEEVICGSASASHTADTTGVTIDGWVTNATHYISIKTDASNRPGTAWNVNKYRLSVSNTYALLIKEDYVRVDGLQLTNHSPTGASRHVVYMNTALTSGDNEIRFSNLLIKGHADASYSQSGIHMDATNAVVKIWNCAVWDIPNAGSGAGFTSWAGSTFTCYSCCAGGGTRGFYRVGGTMVCKNCYAGGSGTSDFSGTITDTTCASEDGSKGATVAYSTATFTNVDGGTDQDWKLVSGSGLINEGTDTHLDGEPFDFTTDIEGDTRS